MKTAIKQVKPKQTIIGNIFETYDYGIFTSLVGNRNVNKSHIKKLKKSISEKYIISPIIVNVNMSIIDGQHRFEAIKELGLPIRYIIDNDADLRSVQLLNAKSKDWTPVDYLDSYLKLGYKEYEKFKEFKDVTGFQHNVCLSLLAQNSGSVPEKFRTGTFKITRIEHAYNVYELVYRCKSLYEGYLRSNFILALSVVIQKKEFDKDVFIRRLSLQRSKMFDCAKTSQYIELIEEIYNYRTRNKVNLRI